MGPGEGWASGTRRSGAGAARQRTGQNAHFAKIMKNSRGLFETDIQDKAICSGYPADVLNDNGLYTVYGLYTARFCGFANNMASLTIFMN